MKKAQKWLLVLFLAMGTLGVNYAQTDFELPDNIKLKSKEDYSKYESDFINAAKWLEETDLNKETEKRQKVNAFVIEYVSGSPTITIEISSQIGKLYEDNPQLLAIYLASYGRHSLENKDATKFTSTKAAVVSMMNVYKKGIKISKNKEMDKIIKLSDEKLDDYIKTKLKAN